MDSTEKNVFCRWTGIKSIWRDIHSEMTREVKDQLENALGIELSLQLGCERSLRSKNRRGYRNGSFMGVLRVIF
jgi:hypothetical protein